MAARTALKPVEECWCCGSEDVPDRMVHLGNHPEVALCPRCCRFAAKQAWEIEDASRQDILASARQRFRHLRRTVVDHGWHQHPMIGKPLRWLGRHLP